MLRKTYLTYVLFDTQTSRNGIPVDPKEILRTLVNMNRFLPIRIIEAWLDYNLSILKHPEKLLPHEYLFLVTNSQDRQKLLKENVKTNFDLSKDPIGIFSLDQSVEQHPNLDFRLENSVLKYQKVSFDFDKTVLTPKTPPAKVAVRRGIRFTENETIRKFKELLKDPDLFFQVKSTIHNSRVLLHKVQNNNGRFSYMHYRKKKGIMGSLESSNGNLSMSVTRNHSGVSKDNLLNDALGLRIDFARHSSRPVSASTGKTRPAPSRPQTAKKPGNPNSLSSTAPVNMKELLRNKSFK